MQRLPVSLVVKVFRSPPRRCYFLIQRICETLLTEPVPLHKIVLRQLLYIYNVFFFATGPINGYFPWVTHLNTAKVTTAVTVAAEHEGYR